MLPQLCRKVEVSRISVANLTPNDRNARTHSKRQISQIAASIREFGFTNPVLIDRHNKIIAGHGRVEAAKRLGMEEVPAIVLEDLNDDQIRAYILADNRLAEKAGWDQSILAIELQHLTSIELGFDVTITGFEVPEIDVILQEASQDATEEPVEIESGPKVTQSGDLWLLGNHRLVCGDALKESSYTELMNGKKADIVFADPPYNVKIDTNVCNIGGNGAVAHREFAMGSGEMTDGEFGEFLEKALHLLRANSASSSVHFVCMDWRHAGEVLRAGKSTYDTLLNVCVWVKDNGGMGSLYRSQHELIFVFRNGREGHRNNIQLGKFGRYRTNVWNYPGVNTLSKKGEEDNLLALHPTVKPLALVADAILDCSQRGDVVLDSFVGSGTTILAAEQTGRLCYALEVDPLYVDVAIRRWQQRTGDVAKHAVTGKSFDETSTCKEVSHA
jgi:DNA modification methylase